MLIRLASGLAAIFTLSWRVGPLAGPAKVIDGDTIVVAGELVRLHGLDAPELDQTFWWRGERIACGMMAMAALEALTAGIQVRCQAVERDRHDRVVAKIFSPDGVDIGRRLVLAGWALAYRQYSTDYVDAEAEARKARRGLWRGTFAKPLGVALHLPAGSGSSVERPSPRALALLRSWCGRLRRRSSPTFSTDTSVPSAAIFRARIRWPNRPRQRRSSLQNREGPALRCARTLSRRMVLPAGDHCAPLMRCDDVGRGTGFTERFNQCSLR